MYSTYYILFKGYVTLRQKELAVGDILTRGFSFSFQNVLVSRFLREKERCVNTTRWTSQLHSPHDGPVNIDITHHTVKREEQGEDVYSPC